MVVVAMTEKAALAPMIVASGQGTPSDGFVPLHVPIVTAERPFFLPVPADDPFHGGRGSPGNHL